MTTMLKNFLNRYSNILSVLADSEVNTPFLNEIKVRVLDQDAWIGCLKKLTRTFPDVVFCRRYSTIGGKFGFNWTVILPGPRNAEDLQQFCDDADAVVGSLDNNPQTQQSTQEPVDAKPFYLGQEQVLDENGKVTGMRTKIRLPGVEETVRGDFKGDAPRVFAAGKGQEIAYLKEAFRK